MLKASTNVILINKIMKRMSSFLFYSINNFVAQSRSVFNVLWVIIKICSSMEKMNRIFTCGTQLHSIMGLIGKLDSDWSAVVNNDRCPWKINMCWDGKINPDQKSCKNLKGDTLYVTLEHRTSHK